MTSRFTIYPIFLSLSSILLFLYMSLVSSVFDCRYNCKTLSCSSISWATSLFHSMKEKWDNYFKDPLNAAWVENRMEAKRYDWGNIRAYDERNERIHRNELETVIRAIKRAKIAGYYKIKADMLKSLWKQVVKFLTEIYN